MSSSIEEALKKAIDELLKKEFVSAVSHEPLSESEEHRPCGFVAKLLNVKHKQGDGSTFSHKIVYIDTDTFDYDWHYGGSKLEPDATPFLDLLKSKLTDIKTAFVFDFIEIQSLNEMNESAILFAIKGTTNNEANTFTIKVWKKTSTTLGYKIIGKTTVA